MKFGTGRHIEAWRTGGRERRERERKQKNPGAKRRGLVGRVDCGQYSWQWVIRLCRFMTAARISGQFRSGSAAPAYVHCGTKVSISSSAICIARQEISYLSSIERNAEIIVNCKCTLNEINYTSNLRRD